MLREWFAGEAAARGLDADDRPRGQPVGVVGRPRRDPRDRHRQPPRLGPGRRRVRRAARRGQRLRGARRCSGRGASRRARPLGIASFVDEEGARFGVACAGSRLITGALDADRARGLRDADGVDDGRRPAHGGPRPRGRSARTTRPSAASRPSSSCTSSRAAAWCTRGDPVGVGRMIWPHGRWRVELRGEANHAGTTPLADRRDPMLDLAAFIAHVRGPPQDAGALATVGKLRVDPNGVNAIPSQVTAWLDVRAEDESAVRAVLAALAGVRPGGGVVDARSPSSTPTSPTSSPARSDDPPRLRHGRRPRRRASSPPRASRRRCSSSATRRASRTPPRRTPTRRTAWRASTRWPRCWDGC